MPNELASSIDQPLSSANDRAVGALARDLLSAEASARTPSVQASDKHMSYFGTGVLKVSRLFSGNTGEATSTEREIASYTTGFVKTGCLFLKGKYALPLTMLAFAADQARPEDSWKEQIADTALGLAKGGVLKGSFMLGDIEAKSGATRTLKSIFSPGDSVLKGVTLGTWARFTDISLSRDTYRDRTTGQYSGMTGLSNLEKGIFNKEAAAIDLAGFFVLGKVTASPSLRNNPLLSTMLVGGTFGVTGGALDEMYKQRRNGQDLDWLSILGRSLLRGGLDSVASMGGGFQARRTHLQAQEAALQAERPAERPTEIRLLDVPSKPVELVFGKGSPRTGLRAALDGPTRTELPKTPGTETVPVAKEVTRPDPVKPGEIAGPIEVVRRLSALDIPIHVQPLNGEPLRLAHEKLPPPTKGEMQVSSLSAEAPAKFDSPADFLQHVKWKAEPAVVYEVGGVRVAVTETYNAKLAKVREYRIELGKNPTEAPADVARRVLKEDAHLANRALPEDFLPGIELLPDRHLIRINLVDTPNPEDVFNRQADKNFTSQASVSREGEVTFYKKEHDGFLHSDLAHEFAHVVKYRNAALSAAFDHASKLENLEPDPYHTRPYAIAVEENWAVHLGEEFLHPNASVFENLINRAPMRSTVFALALEPLLATSTSPHRDAIAGRIAKVKAQVTPKVNDRLVDIARMDPQSESGNMAVRLLAHIGTPAHGSRLTNVTAVSLAGEPIIDRQLAFVAAIPQLTDLDVSGSWITRKGTEPLAKLTALESLNLSGTPVDNGSLGFLRRMERMKNLDLSFTSISDGALVYLPTKGNLQRVDVRGTSVTDMGVTTMLERFRAQRPEVLK